MVPCGITFKNNNIFTSFQFGLPAWVRVLRPVIRSRFSFLWIRSKAICRPIAFMSVFDSADVMYMCISRKRSKPLCSLCSISSSLNKLTNHSNDFWSLLIQKKSTYGMQQQFLTKILWYNIYTTIHYGNTLLIHSLTGIILYHIPHNFHNRTVLQFCSKCYYEMFPVLQLLDK